ncbi:MAG: hypothetical protein L0027_04705 [Candidatus Rokubacteria bacterium]|nr:hypothetical protein [Candidatus Rokubacteria bacterium]
MRYRATVGAAVAALLALPLAACLNPTLIKLPAKTICVVGDGQYAPDAQVCVYDTGQQIAVSQHCEDQGGIYSAAEHLCRIDLPPSIY